MIICVIVHVTIANNCTYILPYSCYFKRLSNRELNSSERTHVHSALYILYAFPCVRTPLTRSRVFLCILTWGFNTGDTIFFRYGYRVIGFFPHRLRILFPSAFPSEHEISVFYRKRDLTGISQSVVPSHGTILESSDNNNWTNCFIWQMLLKLILYARMQRLIINTDHWRYNFHVHFAIMTIGTIQRGYKIDNWKLNSFVLLFIVTYSFSLYHCHTSC